MTSQDIPFKISYNQEFAEIVRQHNSSIAISTYQAGKLIFLSPTDDGRFIQLPRSFSKAMGIGESSNGNKLVLACKDRIELFSRSRELAQHYPKFPNKYDFLYLPRVTYYTSAIDVHDVNFGSSDEIYAVNTLFSCVIKLSEQYNFEPYWKPEFISDISPEDRCHLNGMAMENGTPRYATAFCKGNSPRAWRGTINKEGILIDIKNNHILATGLFMPHSPRILGNRLLCLCSGNGTLVEINRETGKNEILYTFDGFARGLSVMGDYLIVGISSVRKSSSFFGQLNELKNKEISGLRLLHLPTLQLAGKLDYSSSVEEIYDVHVLRNATRPNILSTDKEDHNLAIQLESKTYWGKSEEHEK